MKKALLKDHWEQINNGITQYFSNQWERFVQGIFAEYLLDETIELIFFEDENIENYINAFLSKRSAIYFPYLAEFYGDNAFKTPKVLDKVTTRNTEATGNSASEMQPINSDMFEITSPTAKGKSKTVAEEDISEKNPQFYFELLKYQAESESITKILRKALLPILEIYDKIY